MLKRNSDLDYIYREFNCDDNFDNEENIKKYKETNDIELRNKIILNNLGLVVDIASRYFKVINSFSDDLISFGIMGLMNAIEKYDVDSKAKFSTYAHGVIVSGILCGIENEYGNDSKYYGLFILQYRQLFIKLYGNNNNIYDPYYMNDVLDVMIEQGKITESLRLPLIAAITAMNTTPVVTEEMENCVWEEPRKVPSIEHEYIKNNIDRIIEGLDEKSKQLVLYRYGFIDGQEHTLREIAKNENISFQAVEQRLGRCLRKMRSKVTMVE